VMTVVGTGPMTGVPAPAVTTAVGTARTTGALVAGTVLTTVDLDASTTVRAGARAGRRTRIGVADPA
jgi:hypothetical protein